MRGDPEPLLAGHYQLVAMVASAGGLTAIAAILRDLPKEFSVPIIVAQHLPAHGNTVEYYRQQVPMRFEPIVEGSSLTPGTALVAPPRAFVELMPDGTCTLKPCERGALDKPLDFFLDSVARSFGPYAIGVLLTGLGNDGAAGARQLRDARGRMIVQSETSAEYPDMPRAAIKAGAAELVLPLADVGQLITDLLSGTPKPTPRSEIAAVETLFAGGGPTRAQLREIEWSETPLGPALDWSPSLRSTVRNVLASRTAMVVHWGRDHVQIGNDVYLATFPETATTQGKPASVAWAEQWADMADEFGWVARTGDAIQQEDQPRALTRHGYIEECYFTCAHSPLFDEDGSVAGVLSTFIETTPRVLAERRMRTLHTLVASADGTAAAAEVSERAAAAMATNPRDLPIALIYAIDRFRNGATLIGAAGVDAGTAPAPRWIDLSTDAQPWPISRAFERGAAVFVDDLETRFPGLTGKAWPEPLRGATLLPLRHAPEAKPIGMLIVGASPRLVADGAYRDFFELVASRIGSSLAEAAARELERDSLERLNELDRAKTEFFANVSHEFRTPLTLLLAPLEDLARQRDVLPDGAARDLDVAARNAKRLLGLVNSLLDFSEIDARRRGVDFEDIDLCAVTKDVASTFRAAVEAAGLRLLIGCDEGVPCVSANRDMWERIVSNLLSNAFKFTFDGTISVMLRPLPLHAELIVADTGIGIPADELPNIFKRFHRVRGARARSAEGAGIGLALVDDLVKRMGGQLRVTSIEGRGTTFKIWMPYKSVRAAIQRQLGVPVVKPQGATAPDLASEASRWIQGLDVNPDGILDDLIGVAADQVAGAAGPVRRRGHIVVIDDNADMREYLQRLLAHGWDVRTASDGEQGFLAVTRFHPDVVLADVMMPNMDGFELLKQIRGDADVKHTPVVLVTARAGEEAAIEGLLAGADDYIAKPFSPRELVARVRAVVDRARAEATLRDRAAWLAGQREALEAAVDGAPLSTSLGALAATAVAALGEHARAAFYLANDAGTSLHHVVGMSPEYADAVNGFTIGPESLAGGLAAYRGEAILTADVMSDSRWEPWRWLAEKFGYRACWSFPIHSSAGSFVGTLATYLPEPREATERDQQLASLLTGTASIIISRHQESEARREAESALATELDAMTRLRALSDRLLSTTNLSAALGEVLDTAIALHGADLGTVQVYDPVHDVLRYAAARGFDEAALAAIPPVDRDFHSTCAAAIRTGQQVIVTDIFTNPQFADHRSTAASLDYRAAFSFPLNTRRGEFQGVLTVHFRTPHTPADRELRWAALYAPLAAHLIERHRTEEALRLSEEKYRTLAESATRNATVTDSMANTSHG